MQFRTKKSRLRTLYIPLSKFIVNKKAVVNVRNIEPALFCMDCNIADVICDTSRASSYPHFLAPLNLKGMYFPVILKYTSLFGNVNNISINVDCLES